mmetsp:Transcript_4727/g.12024  ORF Transcript_4727/g.12024 Transcript_4727/m.12024 type:complete len:266 (+) Transcript_4727:95-892(+)
MNRCSQLSINGSKVVPKVGTNLVQPRQQVLVCDLFLDAHTGSSDHGETSVRQFLSLHVSKVIGVGGLQPKGIETDITGIVLLTKSEERTKSRLDPTDVGTQRFCDVDEEEETEQDKSRNFGDLVVGNCWGRNCHTIGNRRCVLPNEVAQRGHHGNTSVHDFGLTEALHTIQRTVIAESKWIEVSQGRDRTGKSITWLGGISDPAVDRFDGRDGWCVVDTALDRGSNSLFDVRHANGSVRRSRRSRRGKGSGRCDERCKDNSLHGV